MLWRRGWCVLGGARIRLEGTQWEPISQKKEANSGEAKLRKCGPKRTQALRLPTLQAGAHLMLLLWLTPEPDGAATSLQILLDSRSAHKIDAVAVVTRPPGTTIRSKSAAEALACAPTCAGRLVLDTQSKR